MEQNCSQKGYGDKVFDTAKKICRYFDETDIQEEVLKKFRNISTDSISSEIAVLKKRFSSPWTSHNQESRGSLPMAGDISKGSPMAGDVSKGSTTHYPLRRMGTESPLPIREKKAEYRKRLEEFYSSERKASIETAFASRQTSFVTSLPKEDLKIEEGKLFISSEYVSDENMMYIYVTQRGNVKNDPGNKQLYLSFQKVDFRGKGDKKAKKLKHKKSSSDFHYTHTYAMKFKSFDHMNYSGMSIQISLKEKGGGPLPQKKTLKMAEVSLGDIELDPASLDQILFF